MKCKYSFVRIGSWNIEGAYVKVNNFYVNKLRDDEFVKNAQAHDILCIQETHCGPHDILTRYNTIQYNRLFSGNEPTT